MLLGTREIADHQVGFSRVFVGAAVAGIQLERAPVVLERGVELAEIAVGVAEIVLEVGIFRVTQRRLSEEALANARSELSRVSRITTLGALTASIAHEVNQPLAGIMTNANTCMRMLNADTPNVEGARETVRRTIRDANRASDVIAAFVHCLPRRRRTSNQSISTKLRRK